MSTQYLTPDQYAQRYNIPKSTLANWRSLGKGPKYKKIEGHIRYIDREEA
ncbi:hypothetical protein HMPREF1484_02028 [Dermabacter sp. HFH0086]|uniref:DNA-binding protein n=1 Tax=Dermabacter vaginalis TaxID=1630135 RepID=A0ABX6A5I6_9MICO|nr:MULTISPECIES: helix-turn-helix domain-containing protein [Dermabacter]EPH14719.1 hypothetical protein HMPREF1484_02028 [Dermabacter sp. HFH0086]MDU4693446.1 DNA-binding protein [Dermabacter sp.]QEU11611.1 DNA-binding protein [Dermabacter vaginalis]